MILIADALDFDVGVGGRLPRPLFGRVSKLISIETDGVNVGKAMFVDEINTRLDESFL